MNAVETRSGMREPDAMSLDDGERQFEEICRQLAVLEELGEGQKLRIAGRSFTIATPGMVPQCVQRVWTGDGRMNTFTAIERSYRDACRCVQALYTSYRDLRLCHYAGGSEPAFSSSPHEMKNGAGDYRPEVCERELYLRQRFKRLTEHLRGATKGIDRLERTYASDTDISIRFRNVSRNISDFLVRLCGMWGVEHQLVKQNSRTSIADSSPTAPSSLNPDGGGRDAIPEMYLPLSAFTTARPSHPVAQPTHSPTTIPASVVVASTPESPQPPAAVASKTSSGRSKPPP